MVEFIDIHTHRVERPAKVFSVVNVLQPAANLPNGYFSSGWHPWHIGDVSQHDIESTMSSVCNHEKLIAIGECGLDRAIQTPIEKQMDAFLLQMDIARRCDKPLIVHCVRAYSDLIYILKKEKFKGKMVIHGFNGNMQQVDRLLDFPIGFSFGKSLFNPTSRNIEAFNRIPNDRIFFETDEADYSIGELYLRASSLREIPLDMLIGQIKKNFNEFVGYGLVE